MSSSIKQLKITLRADKEPEIYAWAETLPYGAFPKIVLEILNWCEANHLLISSGMVPPDMFFTKRAGQPVNISDSESRQLQKELLSKVNQILELANSGQFKVATAPEIAMQSLPIVQETHQPVSTMQAMHTGEAQPPETDIADQQEVPAIPSPFAVFKRGQ